MSDPTVKAILPSDEYVAILKRVLEMNEQIIKQNALVIQCVTLPQLMVKPGEWVEVKP
jgi:hypothetical protein